MGRREHIFFFFFANFENIEWEATKRYCVALKPVKVPSADYDASPESVRRALAKGAAAWVAVCPQ